MLTTTLYLDIKTLPAAADRRDALAYLYARKHEKAERKGRELDDFDQFVRTTALDGAQVFTFHQAGRVDEIVAYCRRDVETTRAVYQRLRFIGGA